ncbi:MAG: hypothetical protein K2K31_01185 [Clostridia bacterium]|nr:hypothetical protein [Clostridia bacterium]
MILSFFETTDVLPYVTSTSLLVDGQIIEMTLDEQQTLQEQVASLFEGSKTMPAFGVIFDEMYKEEITSGTYISLRFPQLVQVNGLPFDEIVFKVESDWTGVNLYRGINGVFNGRCIYIEFDKNMNEIYNFIHNLESVKQLENNAN